MFFRKYKSYDGSYIDQDGIRYDVCATKRQRGDSGINVGYTEFPDLKTALEAWGLSLAPEPPPEPPAAAPETEDTDIIDI